MKICRTGRTYRWVVLALAIATAGSDIRAEESAQRGDVSTDNSGVQGTSTCAGAGEPGDRAGNRNIEIAPPRW